MHRKENGKSSRGGGVVDVVRLEQGEQGTLGVVRLDGRCCWLSLEPPDRGNRPNVSSIPAGEYRCGPVASPRFGETYAVLDVPGRSHILFHAGNTAADTEGCILLGRRFGSVEGRRAVLESRPGLAGFLRSLAGGEGFRLRISEHY